MCATQQAYANTGLATISLPNPNLDGTGPLVTVLAAGHTGTVLNSITIKSQVVNAPGIIRFFLNDGTLTYLYKEVQVQPTEFNSYTSSFAITLSENLILDPGYTLLASTQNPETFNIIANATDWLQCNCTANPSAACSVPQEFANTGIVNISIANSKLDGSGTLATVLTAIPPNPSTNGGTFIPNVNVKATSSNTPGNVRLFISDGSSNFLIAEMPIPSFSESPTQSVYMTSVTLNLFLQSGFSLLASTENAESFNVWTDAVNIVNCPCLA